MKTIKNLHSYLCPAYWFGKENLISLNGWRIYIADLLAAYEPVNELEYE